MNWLDLDDQGFWARVAVLYSRRSMGVAGLLTIVGFVGCTNVAVAPVEAREIVRSRIYSEPFEAVWTAAVDAFADRDIAIEKVERDSGLLTARNLISVTDSELECDAITASNVWRWPTMKRRGSLNVTVREISQAETRVNVNFFGEYEYRAVPRWDTSRPVSRTGGCVSTGQFEQRILDYIGMRSS